MAVSAAVYIAKYIRKFQSTPVIDDWRTVWPKKDNSLRRMFQSTPVIDDGRTGGGDDDGFGFAGFQSTPVIDDGRTRIRCRRDARL